MPTQRQTKQVNFNVEKTYLSISLELCDTSWKIPAIVFFIAVRDDYGKFHLVLLAWKLYLSFEFICSSVACYFFFNNKFFSVESLR